MRCSVDLDTRNGLPTASFWEPKEYQRTVKRVDTANKICSNLAMIIAERAELERAYSNNLKTWSEHVAKLSRLEYGEGVSDLWKSLCREAEAVSNAHESIRDTLLKDIYEYIKDWRKENFQKTSMPPYLKQCKQLEHDFEHAQKPWAKHMKKVNQCKKEYHQACQTERSLQVQVQNARTDPAGTPEQLKKIQDKLSKAEKDMYHAKTAYSTALKNLNDDNPRYLEEMTRVFNGSQDFERKRLAFFKDVFKDICHALNVSTKNDFPNVYREMEKHISDCDIEADLVWWSQNHGVDMPVVFPTFEEYSPEFHKISSKKRTQTLDSSGPVTVTGISTSKVSSSRTSQAIQEGQHAESAIVKTNDTHTEVVTPFDEPESPTSPKGEAPPTEVVAQGTDDVGGDAADYYASVTYDDGRPGITVRALYGYDRQDEDELTLLAGDVFEKLSEADSQGWCRGRKDGRVGLYPANYADVYDAHASSLS